MESTNSYVKLTESVTYVKRPALYNDALRFLKFPITFKKWWGGELPAKSKCGGIRVAQYDTIHHYTFPDNL